MREGKLVEDKTKNQLTAAEMSSLWGQYINDSVATCVSSYFLSNVEDEEVRPIIEFTLTTAKNNLSVMRDIFRKDNFPIPVGFTEEDVNLEAPKLFSDTFALMYYRNMSVIAMAASAVAIGSITRPDVVSFHKNVLNAAVTLQDLTRDLMLKQGTYVRPPFITTPDKVDFVEKQKFLAGFIGEKRPLTSIEITHLFLNVQTNAIGKALIMGFAQIAQNEEVVGFLLRGKQIAQKHVDTFSHILKKEDLPAPMSWDTSVSDSTTKVFSDKLIMFHISTMIAAGVGNYGAAISVSQRRDVAEKYASLIPEISLYAEDGANIMIKHGWMEEPPQTDNRDTLAKGE
jgi:hypothetical protein